MLRGTVSVSADMRGTQNADVFRDQLQNSYKNLKIIIFYYIKRLRIETFSFRSRHQDSYILYEVILVIEILIELIADVVVAENIIVVVFIVGESII